MTTKQAEHATASRSENRPVDASMTLLKEIMERPLDPGYAEAAERKETGGSATRSAPSKILTLVLLGLLTALVTIAVVALRTPQAEVDRARSLLEQNIESRNSEYQSRKESVEALESEIQSLQEENLSLPGQRLLEAAQRLGIATGATAVSGSGITLELRDARPSSGEAPSSQERVQDFDLQVVVNGLWAAGAEAIAINGHRITAMSAIRSAGDAVLVDFQPLQEPYVIEAIGEPNRLETGIVSNQAGQHLQILSSAYNIGVSTKTSDNLELPSGSDTVRNATIDVRPQDIPGILTDAESRSPSPDGNEGNTE
ncbi:MAG TPA: DUF881 domain-containing protein [Actinomycetales bacterium]|nr:DUF881 domain-containing protein [Actinomycetales bacterium]